MTFYVVLWIIVMVLGVDFYFFHKLPSKKMFVLLISFLSCIVGARGEYVGADTWNYVYFYDTGIAPDKNTGMYEPIFMLIRYICYHLGFTHFLFFFILTFSSLYILYLVTKELRINNYYMSFFIYFSIVFLSYQFNTIRTGVMASLIWLAFVYKIKGMEKKSIITMIIAAGFHLVALIFIPMLFFIHREFVKKIVVWLIIVALFCVFLRLGERLIALFPILNEIDRVAGYINVDESHSYGLTLGTIVNIVLFLYMYLYYNNSYKNMVEFRVILNSMLLAFMVVCVFNSFHAIVTRVGQVLNLSLMFVWPLFINRLRLIPLKMLTVLFLILYLWLYYSKGLEATSSSTQRLTLIPYIWDFNGLFR